MSCSCREIKNKAGPLKWLLSGKSCSGCHRLVCQFCAPNNDKCRDCKLRINIKLDRSTLIQMPEEDLIDLAEANGVTITQGVLLKSELVTLILLTCQSFKIPMHTQTISSSEEFKNTEELKITNVLNLLEENSKTLSSLSVHEVAEVMRSLGMKENHREETEQDVIKTNFMLHIDTQKQNMGLNLYQIPKPCAEYCTSDTATTQNQDLLATTSKSHSCENNCIKKMASNCGESDTLETHLRKPQIEDRMLDEKVQLDDVKQKEELISLESITNTEQVQLLRNSQLKHILESHGINTASFNEKDALASTLLQLWLEKRNSQPEASLRAKELNEAALPSEEAKEKFIKVQKRRCIYVSNSDKKTSANCQQDSKSKDTSPDFHSSSKKKKIGHEEDTCSSGSDANCVSRKCLGNIATPKDIEHLSVDDLCSILEAHSIVHEKTCDKWPLAFQVLKLWYSNKCKETNENDNFCIICMKEPVNCTILECGHTGTCFTCSEELKECPICRQAVTRVIRIFKP